MGKPHPTWSHTVSVSEEMRDYSVRLTPKWSEKTSTAADASPNLSPLVYELLVGLRSVEIMASFPFSHVNQLDKFAEGYIRGGAETSTQQIVGAIAARLVSRLDIRDADLRLAIQAECLAIAEDARSATRIANVSSSCSPDEVWRNMLDDPGFRLALEASQHQGVTSTYNAYEHFLVRCVAAALRRQQFRKKSAERFRRDLTEAFGATVCCECWDNREVALLRAARNSITHAGARETHELQKLSHPFHVSGGLIHLQPAHVKCSLRIVENGVARIVEAALVHPSFDHKRKKL